MQKPETGYLLIADITGYTRFLKDSELEHARGILEQLFSALLAKLRSPFALSNIQGDAILAHARADHVSDGRHVLDTVESLYCGFADALETIQHNTTSTCAACSNIAKLDLKLFAHYGSYSGTQPPNQSAMVEYVFASGAMAQLWMSYEVPVETVGELGRYLITGSRGVIDFNAYGDVRVDRGDGAGWVTEWKTPPFQPSRIIGAK